MEFDYHSTFGTPTLVSETLDGTDQYDFSMSYTSTGRLDVLTYPETTDSYSFAVNYDYDAWGNMTLAKDADTGAPFHSLKETDGYGREVWSEFGNGIDEVRTFDAANGRLYQLTAGTTYGASTIQDLEFEWYDDGNLYRRHNHNISATETLVYDEVDRLTQAQVTGEDAVDVSYSDAGRIETKDGVGTYAYGAGSAGPFAVTSANGISYGYDDNGRMTSRGSDTQTWYSYDLPYVLKNGSTTATFSYGVNRARYKQVLSTGVTIRYVNGLFEEEDDGSTTTYRHYVHVGDRVVAMMERVGTTNTVQYLHRDHQYSIVEVTDSSGSLVQSLAYDSWGLRRDPTDWSDLASPFGGSQPTRRGYTGHEHLDPIGLIHMNGRVQDPVLGRFISADPIVQAPYDGRSFDRYAYVWNNPLVLTDPSGFEWEHEIPWGWDALAGVTLQMTSYHVVGPPRDVLGYGPVGRPFGADTQVPNHLKPLAVEGPPRISVPNSSFDELPSLYSSPAPPPQRSWLERVDPLFCKCSYDFDLDNLLNSLPALGPAGGAAGEVGAGIRWLVGGIRGMTTARGVWSMGPVTRGVAIEQALGSNLPGNFPVIDRFANGIATSIKSLDLGAKSYQSASALTTTVTRYIDQVAAFTGRTWGGVTVRGADITGRSLELAVPAGTASAAQQAALAGAVQYGQTVGVAVKIIPY